MPPLHYRLRVRNAGDSADLISVSTLASDTHPYVLTTPDGEGESFDPLTGKTIVGALTMQIVDAPHATSSRVITRELADADKRWQLLGKKAIIEYSDVAPVAWSTLLSGYLTRLEMLDALAF